MIVYSIIQKSQLEGAHRLDAEYYQPEYLEAFQKIKNLHTVEVGSFCKVADGDHSRIPGFVETDGARYLRAKDLQNFFIDDSDPVYVSKPYFERLRRSHIKPLDIILSIMGTVGNLAIVLSDSPVMTANRAVSIISPKNQDLFNSYFLAVYLESKYGVAQRERESMGGVQERVNLDDLARIKVPVVSMSKQQIIINVFKNVLDNHLDSQKFYKAAEDLLFEELGLKDFQVEDDLSFVVNLSDVESAKRVDAEYFRPKYEELVAKIKNKKRLEEFVASYSTGFPFKSNNYVEAGRPLIRINNIKKGYLDLGDTAFLTERDYALSSKDTAKARDIVLSMSGTIGMAAVIPEDVPACSVNQRILKFTPKNIDGDYLVLILNSIVGFYQLERIGTGGVQTNISYKDIKDISIPDLPKPTQQKIADLVRKSHEARKKSKELLEAAKRKVEEMIEKGSN